MKKRTRNSNPTCLEALPLPSPCALPPTFPPSFLPNTPSISLSLLVHPPSIPPSPLRTCSLKPLPFTRKSTRPCSSGGLGANARVLRERERWREVASGGERYLSHSVDTLRTPIHPLSIPVSLSYIPGPLDRDVAHIDNFRIHQHLAHILHLATPLARPVATLIEHP